MNTAPAQKSRLYDTLFAKRNVPLQPPDDMDDVKRAALSASRSAKPFCGGGMIGYGKYGK